MKETLGVLTMLLVITLGMSLAYETGKRQGLQVSVEAWTAAIAEYVVESVEEKQSEAESMDELISQFQER